MELAKKFSEARTQVLQCYELTEEDVNRYISELKTWLKNQKHLPVDLLTDDFLERFLLKNKFVVEKTKTKIENYCTLRKKYKQFYENYEEIIPSKEHAFMTPMFQMNDDFHRIIICKIFNEKQFNFTRSIKAIMLMLEMESRFDYSCGDIFIVDMAGTSASLITKINFLQLKDALTLAIKAYSARVKAVHVINCPKMINILMTILKAIVPRKIYKRILIHHSLDILYEHFPKNYLPRDYGGELESLNTIIAHYDLIFEECQQLFAETMEIKSDETMRAVHSTSETAFRKLQID